MAANIINTAAQIKDLVTRIESSVLRYSFLFIDLEGVNLSRHGSISIMQILIGSERTVHMINIQLLQQLAFDTASNSGLTLRRILESERYPKVFFDVRTDSDALYAHYQINLHCVVDLQLMEFITRSIRGQFLTGLTKCIERDLNLTQQELLHLKRVKEAGRGHFSPERGGRYEIFNNRPLNSLLIEYCVQDIQFMPRLLMRYAARLQRMQAIQVQNETSLRIQQSQGSVPVRKGRHLAIGPIFAAVQTTIGHAIHLAHPMDIICSPALGAYCEVHQPYDPFTNPNVVPVTRTTTIAHQFAHSRHASMHGPIQSPTDPTPYLSLRRSSHPSISDTQDRSFIGIPSYSSFLAPPGPTTFMATDTIPAYANPMPEQMTTITNVSRAPTTGSQALFQLSSRTTPDETISPPQQYEPYEEVDDAMCRENNMDIDVNAHYGSLSFLDEDDDNNKNAPQPGHPRRQH